MKKEKKQCDVLCMGGGIAGLMAAIHARELGAEVIVAEKSNTLRSGAAGMGNDHFVCYIPEVHQDLEVLLKDLMNGQMGPRMRMMDGEMLHAWFESTHNIIKMWESWGIPMKDRGEYEFAGHTLPGRTLAWLKYSGEKQKYVLTKQAVNKGVKIINRVMGIDLIQDRDGYVIGALGISTREPKIIEFEAKSVVLGTGGVTRLWPSSTPSCNFNRAWPGTLTGDGRMMAYRSGAPLANLELSGRHYGPKYFARAGQATWIGVLRDRAGNPIGPFIDKPNRIYGDSTMEIHSGIFDEYIKSGRGPIYMDMNGISGEDLEYMVYWLKHEGNIGLLNHLAEEGVDLGKAAVEFMPFELSVITGIMFNFKGETAVKGLYAAGDEGVGGISAAATFGWSAGENAGKYAKMTKKPDIQTSKTDIEARESLFEEILTRNNGAKWQEVNEALQQIMQDYCGGIRSAVLLDAGLDVVRRLKDKANKLIMAGNPHELMHCMEVMNLLDIGELVMICAAERKETRGMHKCSDYTFTNPIMGDKRHLIKKGEGKPVTEWEEIRR